MRLFALTIILAQLVLAQAKFNYILKVTDDSTGKADLSFGLDPAATDGIDRLLGEEEFPPYPPTGIFDARFIGDDIGLSAQLGLGVQKDFRTGDKFFQGKKNHELRFQPGKGSVIRFSWNFPPVVSGKLNDLITGTIVNVAMSGAGSYVLTNPIGINKLKFEVTYGDLTGVKINGKLPDNFELKQNYPNPFNPVTIIRYSIPKSSQVKITLYNSIGVEINTLVNSFMEAGNYELKFDAANLNLSTGIYFYKISTGRFSDIKKMVYLK